THVNPGVRTGLTSTTHALPSSPGGSLSNLFPVLSVDQAGRIYVVWSDVGDHNIYYSYSTTQGNTWSDPVQVNQGVGRASPYVVPGGPARSNVFAWSEAGTEGKLLAVWLGEDSTNLSDDNTSWATDPAAATGHKWYGYVALISGADTATPSIEQDAFTP